VYPSILPGDVATVILAVDRTCKGGRDSRAVAVPNQNAVSPGVSRDYARIEAGVTIDGEKRPAHAGLFVSRGSYVG
jgi:hypothetical protein